MAKQTKAEKMIWVAIASKSGETSGNPLPPATFPPSEAVFYIASENNEVLLTENGDALVTEQSAT
jgi:hypothetical protein